jgi:hypothetical protein
MTQSYTTEELISAVRRRARVPNTQIPGTADDDILECLNEEMKARLVPGLMKAQEDHLLRTWRETISSSTTKYPIPSRAVGLKLSGIFYRSTNGEMTKLIRGNKLDSIAYTSSGSGVPTRFYLEGPRIVLVPEAGSYSGTIEMDFYMRPGDMVKAANYRKVASIVSSTEITLDSDKPTSWGATLTYDVHSPNSGAEMKAWNRSVSTISGTQVIFSEAIDGTVHGDRAVEVGDYFVEYGTAAVPSLPTELHVPLILAAASALKRPLDPESAELLRRDLTEMLAAAGYTIDRRVESSPPSVSKRNPLYGDSQIVQRRRV